MKNSTKSNFWGRFGNRHPLTNISSFLYSHERHNLIYLNKVTNSLSEILLSFEEFEFKEELKVLTKKHSLAEILKDDALFLSYYLSLAKHLRKKEEYLITTNLIAKHLNYLYFMHNNSDQSENNNCSLNLSSFELKQKGTYYLLLILAINDSLTTVNLADTLLDIRALNYINRIKTIKKWETLILDGSIAFGFHALDKIIKIFNFTPTLKTLSIKNAYLEKITLRLLMEGISHLSQLENLILDDNPLELIGIKYLFSVICSFPNFSSLSIKNCKLTLDKMFFETLDSLFENSKTIQELDIGNNKVPRNFRYYNLKYFGTTCLKRLKLNLDIYASNTFQILELFMGKHNNYNPNLKYIELPALAVSNYYNNKYLEYIERYNMVFHFIHYHKIGDRDFTAILNESFTPYLLGKIKYTIIQTSIG
jgi:hypothetical protein